jgi:hyperosmotically inducible periplasmic protein
MRLNTKQWVLAGSLGLAACMGGLTGCASADRSSGQVMDDMLTARRVSGALNDSPIYKFNDIDVKSYNGVVQLSGWAMAPEQKRKAEEIAKNVRGVRQVINNVSLKTEAMGQAGVRTTGRATYQGGASGEVQVEQDRQSTSDQQRLEQERQEQQRLIDQEQQRRQEKLQQEQQRQEQLRRQQLTP